MQGGLGLHARSPQDVVFLAFVPTAKASGNAPAHYSRPTQKQLRNWDSLTDALVIFRDVHRQSYACRLRESRGKPQDVVVCHKMSPKAGGGIEEELTNPPSPDRISTAGFSQSFGRGVENACKDVSAAPKGRKRKAWGVSPRKASTTTQKPRRGDSSFRGNGLLPPLRGWGFFWSTYLGLTPQALCCRPFRAERSFRAAWPSRRPSWPRGSRP